MDPTDPTPLWWLNAAQAPIVGALYWLVHGIKRDLDRIDRGDLRQVDGLSRTRDELAAFKLEVARTYVPLSLIRDVDRRLTEQLIRIENKLGEVRRRQEKD
ncbi:hypothetical protein EJV46_12225 [Roseococcus sp. SYP-B2431]|uniref:hypothetical protein n=1 Tax=Roseococcus sp. SYP-B2431 TaxID=2496640 RepID=UPI001039C204|nr:hypothetical protein [Roseococcus sp. SYP-B2431]TCH97975.1 hypothetical protein EJV46_12225 [Roseococcus sp. SYP-B2431]